MVRNVVNSSLRGLSRSGSSIVPRSGFRVNNSGRRNAVKTGCQLWHRQLVSPAMLLLLVCRLAPKGQSRLNRNDWSSAHVHLVSSARIPGRDNRIASTLACSRRPRGASRSHPAGDAMDAVVLVRLIVASADMFNTSSIGRLSFAYSSCLCSQPQQGGISGGYWRTVERPDLINAWRQSKV